jgi:hypothetical protein
MGENNTIRDEQMHLRLSPRYLPPLSELLPEVLNPTLPELAKFWGVSPRTARRWVKADKAPRSAMVALYWMTWIGWQEIDHYKHRDFVTFKGLAEARADQVAKLQKELARVLQAGDFGCANDFLRDAPPTMAQQAAIKLRRPG